MSIRHSKDSAQNFLDRMAAGEEFIFTPHMVKGLLSDVVKLHEEVEHERKEKDHWRIQATSKQRVKGGW